MSIQTAKKPFSTILRVPSMSKVSSLLVLVIILAVMFVVFSILTPRFLTVSNILSVLRQASSLFMLACGQTLVVLVKGLDLSQGSTVGLVSVVVAMITLLNGPFMGILLGLLAGILIGLISGFTIAKAKVPAFAATLGMMFIVEGITLIITNGQPIFGLSEDSWFTYIGAGLIGRMPFPAILFIVVAILFYFILKYTRFGRYLYAIGGNDEAARLSGIQVERWMILAYVVNGLLVATGAIILTSRVNSGQPLLGGGIMMESVGAVVIGGTSLFGGIGGIFQTLLGVCFLAYMVNGLTIMGMSTFVRQTLVGALIIIAVYLSAKRTKNK